MHPVLLLCAIVGQILSGPVQSRLPLVAVGKLHAIKVDSAEVEVLGESMASALVATSRVRVMERAQVDRVLSEQGFQQSGACEGGNCAVQVGQLLGVDRIVVGSVGRVGRTTTLNLRTVDVASGEVVGSSSRTVQGDLEAVIQILPDAARELVGNVATTSSPRASAPVQAPLPSGAGAGKGFLGFRYVRPGPPGMQAIRSLKGVPDTGAAVSEVVPGSPAAVAGLKSGDLVLEENGAAVYGVDQLRTLLAGVQPGEVVTLRVLRSGKPLEVRIQAGARP